MLKFILGRAGSGKTTACLNALKEKLIENPQGSPLIILLPDHMTFAVERQLALELKDYGGFTRAYVLGMSRLAYQILLRSGGLLHPHLNEVGKELLLSRVLNSTKLSILAKAARQQHFTASVSQIIEEFKTSGISVSTLKDILNCIDNDSLKQKLSDLTTIYEGLNEQMSGRYHDSEDMLELAIRKISTCEWLKDAQIWVDGFDALNPQHLRVIEELLKTSANMTVTLCLNNLDAIEHESPTALFHRQFKLYSQLKQIAHKASIEINTKIIEERPRFHKQDLSFIEQQLFKFPLKTANYSEGLQLIETPNRRLECEAVASDILRLCREQNYRHYDIGVLIRSSEDYTDLLQSVLNDYNIPYFSDAKRQSAHHPLAELIRSSLEAITTWQYEPLFRAFKTDFFNVKYQSSLEQYEHELTTDDTTNIVKENLSSRDAIDDLENYVLAFGIKGKKRWTQEEDWDYVHHRSLDSLGTDILESDRLTQINHTRRSLITPLNKFAEAVQDLETVSEFTRALYDYLIDLNIPEQLQKMQENADNAHDMTLAKEHHQIWDSLINLMDQLVQTCGNDYINLQDYLKLVNDGLDSIKIALIPPGYDYITLASFEHNTLNNKKAIYILGANEKIMPRHAKTEGLLSDAERLLMASLGLNISGGTLEDNFAERYYLYKGFTLATDYLWISYSLADSEGNGLNKSILISRLLQILPKAKFYSIPLEPYLATQKASSNSDTKDDYFNLQTLQITTKRKVLSNLTSALRHFQKNGYLSDFWQDIYNDLLNSDLPLNTSLQGIFAQAPKAYLPEDLAKNIYTNKKVLRGSVTRFEQFFNCPFKHFAHYALRLEERKEFRFSAPDLGVLLHAIMHQFGERLLQKQKSWAEVSPEECTAICDDIVNNLAPRLQNEILLSSNRYKHLLSRIKQLAIDSLLRLIEFAKHSEFTPKALEQNFGLNSTMPPLLFNSDNGNKIEITGQIDRIDTKDNYFLVIDYKSGNAFINLLQVYYGLKLQLLTYLLVAKNATLNLYNMSEAIPAGILYCFLKTPTLTSANKLSTSQIQSEITKKMRMPGWILADTDVIKKIDDSLSFIKVRLNKNQDDVVAQSRSYVKTEEEFNLLLSHIEKILTTAGNNILKGDASIKPYKLKDETACKYCSYISICRFDKYIPGYVYNEILEENDDTIIDKLKHNS